MPPSWPPARWPCCVSRPGPARWPPRPAAWWNAAIAGKNRRWGWRRPGRRVVQQRLPLLARVEAF